MTFDFVCLYRILYRASYSNIIIVLAKRTLFVDN